MRDHTAAASPPGPLDAIVGRPLATLSYLGGLALLAGSIPLAIARPRGRRPGLLGAVVRQVDWMIGMGMPLAMLANVGMGSFLAMQAFYGATFIEAAGPVVGSGLIRALAPLLSGFVFAGLFAARIAAEVRARTPYLDADPADVPDRGEASTGPARFDPPTDGQVAAARVLAAVVAGPPIVLAAAAAGVGMGGVVAEAMLGMPPAIFYSKLLELLWVRDVVGLLVKGSAFAGVAALLATYEGLRDAPDGRTPASGPFRAALVSAVAILILNNAWFTLVYLGGAPFGPTVMTPPPR